MKYANHHNYHNRHGDDNNNASPWWSFSAGTNTIGVEETNTNGATGSSRIGSSSITTTRPMSSLVGMNHEDPTQLPSALSPSSQNLTDRNQRHFPTDADANAFTETNAIIPSIKRLRSQQQSPPAIKNSLANLSTKSSLRGNQGVSTVTTKTQVPVPSPKSTKQHLLTKVTSTRSSFSPNPTLRELLRARKYRRSHPTSPSPYPPQYSDESIENTTK
jgi:hypothetical protein